MVVDVQCIMPALPQFAKCFHTKSSRPARKAKFPGADAHRVRRGDALEIAKQIVSDGRSRTSRNRKATPSTSHDVTRTLVAGFTAENIF